MGGSSSKRIQGILCLIFLAAMVSSCTQISVPDGTRESALTSGSQVYAEHPSTGASFEALLTGTLILENECLLIKTENDERTIPVFAKDSVVWNGATLIFDNHSYAIGDEITLVGGETETIDRSSVFVPDGCAKFKYWIVG
jgi:hypothetical protein